MIVKNPHKEDISMVYKGHTYTVEAGGVLKNVPEEVARHWQTMVHEFIKIEKDAPVVIEPPVEKKEEPKEVKQAVVKPAAKTETK